MAKSSGKPTTPKLGNPLTPALLAAALASAADLRLLDVRTPAEFDSMRIDGSHNIPLAELAAHAEQIASVPAPVVIICRSGARARTAEAILRAAGARRIHVLDGGVLSWRDAGQPVASESFSVWDVPRLVSGMLGLGAARDRTAAIAALTAPASA